MQSSGVLQPGSLDYKSDAITTRLPNLFLSHVEFLINHMLCTVCVLTPYNKVLPIVIQLIPNAIHSNTLMWVGIIYIPCLYSMDIC